LTRPNRESPPATSEFVGTSASRPLQRMTLGTFGFTRYSFTVLASD
jgi:hypothetical protein